MKRIILILMLVVLVVLLIPYASAIAQLLHTPHEDPATAESGFDIALPLLLHYDDILSLLAEGKYQDVKALIEQLDLDHANIPEDIKFTMQTYNGLLSDLSDKLDSLDDVLDTAELFLAQHKLEETRQELIEAKKLIEEARVLVEDVDEATDELIGLLGPFAPAAEVETIDGEKARLQEAMERLKELEALYEASLQSIEAEVEKREELFLPNLTLKVDKSQAWAGDSITASGKLTSAAEGEQPLPNRKISIRLNEEDVAITTTDENGRYETEEGRIKIPYLYISKMTFQASYVPEGEDIDKYAPSLSPPVEIETLFYSTELTLEVPEQVYPGLPYIICGQITYDAGASSIEREIKLFWDDELLGTLYSYQDAFELEASPDDQTTLGEHILEVIVKSQDRYSNASEDKTLTIVKESPEIRIDNLSFTILSRKVQVKGKLYSELPLQEAIVSMELKGTSTRVSTSSNGEFEALLCLPLGSIPAGEQEVKIRVEPSEAWHSPTEMTADIFIVDIVNIGLISTASVAIGVILYTRRRGSPRKEGVEILKMPPLQEPTEVSPWTLKGLEGTRERVLKTYAEAMEIVENATKVLMKPDMTLREFLKETTPKLNGAVEAFSELTYLAEGALYSPYMPGLDETTRAESLALIMREVLRHGRA